MDRRQFITRSAGLVSALPFAGLAATQAAAVTGSSTIVELAVATPDLSTLVTAVQAAGLVDTLSADGNFTVFAPTNRAFAHLPHGVLDSLLADPAALANVLTYHVSGDYYPASALVGQHGVVPTVQGGTIDFDWCIATPDMMGQVGRLGRVLGPRGLMPNPKVGTVTFDVNKAVSEAKAGKVEFRVERAGIVHAPVGRVSFDGTKLVENVAALISALVKAKPAVAKGTYLKSITLSSTMGPGLRIDPNTVTVEA